MLRRVEKERRGGENEDVKRIVEENGELASRIEEMVAERKREIEAESGRDSGIAREWLVAGTCGIDRSVSR